jgi:hypothetical protein
LNRSVSFFGAFAAPNCCEHSIAISHGLIVLVGADDGIMEDYIVPLKSKNASIDGVFLLELRRRSRNKAFLCMMTGRKAAWRR